MRLNHRVADLERRSSPQLGGCVSILQYEGRTKAEAVAAYEAKHGVQLDEGVLRVFINKPFPAPALA